MTGASHGPFECQLTATSAPSFCFDELHDHVLGAPLDDMSVEDARAMQKTWDEIATWVEERGAQVGSYLHYGIDAAGPRHWPACEPDDKAGWIQLWEPVCAEARLNYGSACYSLMIREADLTAGALERAQVLHWQ